MELTRHQLIRLGVLGALTLLLVISLVCNVVRSQRYNIEPKNQTAADFVVTWRCLECGHELKDLGGPGPRECPQCGKHALYASIRFSCSRHGVFRVAFDYDDECKPTRVKVGDGPWVAYFDQRTGEVGTVCPECGVAMNPAESPRVLRGEGHPMDAGAEANPGSP